jgi:hypothetical protein
MQVFFTFINLDYEEKFCLSNIIIDMYIRIHYLNIPDGILNYLSPFLLSKIGLSGKIQIENTNLVYRYANEGKIIDNSDLSGFTSCIVQ